MAHNRPSRNEAKYERKTKLMRFIPLLISIARTQCIMSVVAVAAFYILVFTIAAYDFVLMNFLSFFRFLLSIFMHVYSYKTN